MSCVTYYSSILKTVCKVREMTRVLNAIVIWETRPGKIHKSQPETLCYEQVNK